MVIVMKPSSVKEAEDTDTASVDTYGTKNFYPMSPRLIAWVMFAIFASVFSFAIIVNWFVPHYAHNHMALSGLIILVVWRGAVVAMLVGGVELYNDKAVQDRRAAYADALTAEIDPDEQLVTASYTELVSRGEAQLAEADGDQDDDKKSSTGDSDAPDATPSNATTPPSSKASSQQ